MTEPEAARTSEGGMLEKLIGWLTQQKPQTALLTMVLAAVAYGAWYGLPAVVKQVQVGYEQMDAGHLKQIEKLDTNHANVVKEMDERHLRERQDLRIERREMADSIALERESSRAAITKVGEAAEKTARAVDALTDTIKQQNDRSK